MNTFLTQSTSVENTPVQFPAVLGKRAKVVEVPDTCGPFARQITENCPQCPAISRRGVVRGLH